MDNQLKQLVGSWIQASGTVIAAIGSTQSLIINEEHRNHLSLWGNVLQAVGNALIADGQITVSLDKLGNEVQAIGNTTVVGGILISFKEETKQLLIIKGNWLQALGGAMSTVDAIEQESTPEKPLNITGNLLQVIGNSLQAIGGTYQLEDSKKRENKQRTEESLNYISYYSKEDRNHKDGESIEMSGGWIQAVGSVISAIAQTKEGMRENT